VTARAWDPAPLPLDRAEVVCDLERLVYGDAEVAGRPFYDWLYRGSPAGEAVIWYAATGDPAAASAGHYAVVPMRVALRGTVVTGSVSVNTVTHPSYRRQGVFVALAERVFAECARRGIAFTYGFPNPSSLPGFVGPLRFVDIGRVPLLVAPLDARGIAPPAADPARRLLLRPGARLAAGLSALVRARGLAGHGPASELAADAPEWDRLWARLAGKYPVMIVRDRSYLAWRFGACPTRRYRLYVAGGEGGAAGLAVTRVGSVLGMRAGLVVDLLVARGAAGRTAGLALLGAAMREFAEAGVALATSLMPPIGEEYACLRRAGFFPCPRVLEPQPFPVILRRHGATPAVPGAIGEWLLTMGDYDAV
jgi:GNAT superfamily N-acetyltransferase